MSSACSERPSDHDRLKMLAWMAACGDTIMLLADPETRRFVEVSPAAERFYGWSRDEFLELLVSDVNPIERDEFDRAYREARADGLQRVFETAHLTKSGETRDVEVCGRTIEIADKAYVLATVFDLAQRRHVLDALEASEERYRTLVELTPDALFVQTCGRFAYVNPATVQLFGAREASDLLGREILSVVHPDDRAYVAECIRRARDEKLPAPPHRHRYLRLDDGSAVDAEVAAVPIVYGGEPGAQVLARDVSEQTRTQAVLAWNAAIVESSDDAIYSEDFDGVVMNWNRAAERMYGFAADEIVGRSVFETIIPPEFAEEHRERLQRMRTGSRPEHFEAVGRRRDRTHMDVAVTLSPIHDADGAIIGISAIGHDISERKQLEKAKDDFFSVVSHELRTPLTTIHGYAQLLADPKRSFDIEQRLKIGKRLMLRSHDMLVLVEELLHATRLHAGVPDMRIEPVEPAELLASLAETFPEAVRGRLRLSAEGATEPVVCDAKWMLVALTNLVGNALKFSPPNEPVTVTVGQTDVASVFSVSDHGPGIDPETLERIFDKFVQADMSSTRLHEGVGLGLYIAHRAVELHGGTLTAESVEGEGSTFTISLPRVPARR